MSAQRHRRRLSALMGASQRPGAIGDRPLFGLGCLAHADTPAFTSAAEYSAHLGGQFAQSVSMAGRGLSTWGPTNHMAESLQEAASRTVREFLFRDSAGSALLSRPERLVKLHPLVRRRWSPEGTATAQVHRRHHGAAPGLEATSPETRAFHV